MEEKQKKEKEKEKTKKIRVRGEMYGNPFLILKKKC